MLDWLPSLNALRAFEAVSRHLNYAHAASELCVTPAAVKQLVAKLEEAVGHRLVRRHGRGLTLTAAGLAGSDGLATGFGQLSRAVERMRRHSNRQRLIVSVEPSFATAWLVPRLEHFRQEHPEIDVLIDSSLKIVDLEKRDADAAIRFGSPLDPRLQSRRLFDERLCAFCSPALVSGPHGLRSIGDLSRATLLHWDMTELTWASATRKWMGWQGWLETIEAKGVDWTRGTSFSDYNLAVQAAVAGQGVVLGSLPILYDLVSAKLLVNPFVTTVETDIGYDLVIAPRALERPEVVLFSEWILREAALAESKKG
jgi:LysR family glycine cleavage system transcriptional activator